MAKTAAEAPDKSHTEMQKPVGDRAGIHDIGGNNEQWHRQKQKPVKQPLHHGFTGNGDVLARNAEIDDHTDDDGISDRRADRGSAEQGQKAEGQLHAHDASCLSSPPAAGVMSASSGRPFLTRMTARHR